MAKREYRRSETRNGEKKCSRCSEWKSFDDYYKKKGKPVSQCKVCQRQITRNWIAENKERNADAKRSKNLLDNYNMTMEQYRDMFEDQEGVCAICLEPETKTHGSTGTTFRLAVDHDHKCCATTPTCGECTRGLLCSTCNRTLGLLNDNAAVLRAAADYLERNDSL